MTLLSKFISSKKAESDHPMWQTIIDIVLFAIVAMTFALFGYMVLQDQRVHQIYYSKDLSLLQNAFYPAHEFMSMEYTGYDVPKSRINLGFGNFTYVFDNMYTSVNRKWKGKIQLANKDVTVSYIHLIKPGSSKQDKDITFANPKAINFTNIDGSTKISTEPIDLKNYIKCDGDTSYLKNGFKTYLYPADLRVQYDQILTSLSPNYVSSMDSIEVDKKNNMNSVKDWSMIVFQPGLQILRITIYYPFGEDNSLACNLYNALIKDDKLKETEIRMIPSNNVVAFKDKYKLGHNVYIEVNPQLQDMGLVMKALADLSRK